MSEKTAADFFQDTELEKWAQRADYRLEIEEKHLLRKWLPDDPQAAILEGGTGAGRLAFFIERMGFNHIRASISCPNLWNEPAVGSSRSSKVRFFQADLCDVSNCESEQERQYDAIVYFQQVFSLVPLDDWDRGFAAVRGLLKPGGKWLASFCQHEGRLINRPLRATLATIRFVRRENITSYSQPLLKRGGKFNRKFFGTTNFSFIGYPEKSSRKKRRMLRFSNHRVGNLR